MPHKLWLTRCLGIIGGGNMAEALVRGVIASKVIDPKRITIHDPLPERRAVFDQLGCVTTDDPAQAAAAGTILLAVKPQVASAALQSIDGSIGENTLVSSIVAGMRCQTIEDAFTRPVKVIRVMPNTPLLVGRGVSAICPGSKADADDLHLALTLFSCAGQAYEVNESMMDAVTALSGSGPAYLFRLAEDLIAAGISLGLPPELAERLTVGTLQGAGEMVSRYGDPAKLRQQVTSAGGTTAAAMEVFDREGASEIVESALKAARDRSVELGRQE